MPKEKETFFDDEEDEEGSEDKKPTKTTSGKTSEETPAKKPTNDETDWKAKFEAAEAEKQDNQFLDELLRFDDTLEGNTLDEIENGKRYRELRKLGLSARTAYAALQEEIAEASPAKTTKETSGKNHVAATSFRATTPKSRMDRSTRAIVDDLFEGISDEEKEDLYRRVKGN